MAETGIQTDLSTPTSRLSAAKGDAGSVVFTVNENSKLGQYDIANNNHTEIATLPFTEAEAIAALNGVCYILGGSEIVKWDGSSITSTINTPNSDNWSGCGLTMDGAGNIYLGPGQRNGNDAAYIDVYDGSSWSRWSDAPTSTFLGKTRYVGNGEIIVAEGGRLYKATTASYVGIADANNIYFLLGGVKFGLAQSGDSTIMGRNQFSSDGAQHAIYKEAEDNLKKLSSHSYGGVQEVGRVGQTLCVFDTGDVIHQYFYPTSPPNAPTNATATKN